MLRLLIILSALLLSCSRNKVKFVPPPDEVADTNIISMDQPDTAAHRPSNFKGLYSYGDEVSTFRDCRTGKVYWLTDSSGRAGKMYSDIRRYPAYPYESMYAEVTGYLTKSTSGYAAEYDHELIITDISRMEMKNFKTECYPYEFIALGNEPFWSADIIPAEDRIVFKEAGVDKAYEFPYRKVSAEGNTYTYETINNKRDRMKLVIRRQQCSDGMSDRQYFYSAALTINGKTLSGCAIRKGDQITDNP